MTKKDRNPEISVFFCLNSKSSLEISNPNGDFGFNNRVTKPQPSFLRARAIGIPNRLEYIVLVIDELSDLMCTAASEVEVQIMCITQLARAAGIHCIITTQRSREDVITGVIKENIPARIAFKVSNRVDSVTILDRIGAEKLLGKGDMLYQFPGGPRNAFSAFLF